MRATAKLNYLTITPRKTRLVADLIRRKKVEQAQSILKFTTKKAAKPILKLLNSAIANAKNSFQLEESNLYISKIIVDEGPKMKRWKPRSRGRADQVLKRNSHITIVLDEIKPEKKARKVVSQPKGKKQRIKPVKEIKAGAKEMEKIKEEAEEKTKIPEETKQAPEKMKQRIKLAKDRKKPKGLKAFRRIFKRKAF